MLAALFHFSMFNMKLTKVIFFLALCLFSQMANAEISEWKSERNDTAKVRLLGSFYKGEKNPILGLHFKIKEGWKVYGAESSDIGVPPSLSFEGSKNYQLHEIIWPKAEAGKEILGKETLNYSYYKDEVILPIELVIKDTKQPVNLKLRLDYGLCKDVCIPGSAEFSLDIKGGEDAEALAEIQKFYGKKIIGETVSEKIPAPKTKSSPLFYMIALALLGGAILNIMPCVLPVLSIKLITVIKHLDSELKRIRLAFFFTTLGILFCFILFSFLAIAIRLGGDYFNWGLQFQNPYFLAFIILILSFFIANLLGIFEFTFEQFIATFLDKKINESEKRKNIFVPNFLSGILAVLLATPCSAPFLGTAITFGLTQNFYTIFLIFIAVGIGFSLPYVILFLAPQMVYLLPKPGSWMLKVKKLMALFLAATILWLFYVISDNIGALGTFLIAILALAFFFAVKTKSTFKRFIQLSLVIAATFATVYQFQNKAVKNPPLSENIWLNFSEELLNNSLKEGKVVVIDITADWCLTCKFNKVRVLQDEEVMNVLKQDNVVALRGDITKPDKKIMDFLHKHKRFAIPFNAVYGPNAKSGLLANELLSKKALLDLIKKAS